MTTAAGRNAAPPGRDTLRAIRRCTCRNFLLLIARPPLSLVPFLCAVRVLWASVAGRAEAHPYRTLHARGLPLTLAPDPYPLRDTCSSSALLNPSDHAHEADLC